MSHRVRYSPTLPGTNIAVPQTGEVVEVAVPPPLVAAGPVPSLRPYANWSAVVTRLGETSDGRVMNAFTWRDVPLAFFARFTNAHGDPDTTGCPIVGEIQSLEWEGNNVIGHGVYYDTPDGRYAAQLGASGSVRYVSVDPAGVKVHWEELDAETGEGRWVFDEYTIGGATQVAIPAMHDAVIRAVEFPTGPELAVVAAGFALTDAGEVAPADAIPVEGPAPEFQIVRRRAADDLPPGLVAAFGSASVDAFHVPEPDDPLRYEGLIADGNIVGSDIAVPFVHDDGTWHGYLAHWSTCHVGIQSQCQTPPADDDFAAFYRRVLEVAGTELPVGHITMATGHASLKSPAQAAAAHYDDTGTRVAYASFVNGRYGIWGRGVINPAATDAMVENFHRSRLSGDWRGIGPQNAYRLIAALVVNYPGFPIPDQPGFVAAGAGAGTDALTMAADIPDLALVASGETSVDPEALRRIADRLAADVGQDPAAVKHRRRADDLAAGVGKPSRRVARRRG